MPEGVPVDWGTQITNYDMGLVVSRLAELLDCDRKDVRVVHYPPKPEHLELWRAQSGMPHTYLGTMKIDPDRPDPYARELITAALQEESRAQSR